MYDIRVVVHATSTEPTTPTRRSCCWRSESGRRLLWTSGMTDAAVTITPTESPCLVKGPVTVLDADGSEYRIDRSTLALGRCGGFANEPFCDGTHSKIGFAAAERAVKAADVDESPE